MRGANLHYPNTLSWCGAQLKREHRDKFTFTFITYTLHKMLLYGLRNKGV